MKIRQKYINLNFHQNKLDRATLIWRSFTAVIKGFWQCYCVSRTGSMTTPYTLGNDSGKQKISDSQRQANA